MLFWKHFQECAQTFRAYDTSCLLKLLTVQRAKTTILNQLLTGSTFFRQYHAMLYLWLYFGKCQPGISNSSQHYSIWRQILQIQKKWDPFFLFHMIQCKGCCFISLIHLLKSMELLLWERDKEKALKFNSRCRQILVKFFCLFFIKEFPGSGPRLCTFSSNSELVDSFTILLQHLSRKHV